MHVSTIAATKIAIGTCREIQRQTNVTMAAVVNTRLATMTSGEVIVKQCHQVQFNIKKQPLGVTFRGSAYITL